MKIGIIGAMAEEVASLQLSLAGVKSFEDGGAKFYQGHYAGHEVYLVQSGIGKVAAAVTASVLLAKYQVDILINTGSAGGIGSGLNIGDIVLAKKLAYHDVDVTAFGYRYGQMAGGFPLYYETDENLLNQANKVMEKMTGTKIHQGLIVSGDQFVHDEQTIKQIKEHFPDALANEMESTAIAQVAYQFSIPVLIVRAISDTADSNANVDFDSFIKEAGRKSAEFVCELLKVL